MEESTGISTSAPSEAVTSTASANSLPPENVNYEPVPSHVDMYPNNSGQVEEMAQGERPTIPLPELKNMLRQQLEYYFSRENLSTDTYLNSQMDADNYVPIKTVANFNQIRRLTDDTNLVVETLRESAVVQVDETGEKVRPNPRCGVLILREIPENTPLKEIEELFNSENCPKFTRCEFAHNNSWYVLFETDEDTQKAYRYLREEGKTFNGKPVMARIKAKAITSAPFTTSYKNGVGNVPEADTYNTQNVNQQQQQNPVQYTYTNVPSEGYNNQQVCPPFYPPTMLQTWAPTTPACVDLGTVLSVNGLSPQAAFRPLNSNGNRHNYSSRDRPVKAYTPQNYNFSRSEQSRYFNRGQSTSYLQRQQLHQQPFHNLVNTNNCGFEYMPYTSRSRNMTNFGMDMNFFTAPNLYYSKLPSIYPTHASQARHNPVLMPRNQVGLSAINSQDQNYLATSGNNAMLPFNKDSVLNSSSGGSSKQTDSQVKENWGPNQRQRGNRKWWKDNGTPSSSKSFPESSNGVNGKTVGETDTKPESPKFDLETSSFPPLPGCLEPDSIELDTYSHNNRLSDIVKGTVKPTTRDTKTQTESATKDSSTITIKEAGPSDGAFTPPVSPDLLKDAASSTEPLNNIDNGQECNDWEDFVETTNDSSLCNTSINAISVVPEVPTAFSSSSSPMFQTVSTNSVMNGSVTTSTETVNNSTQIVSEPETVTNVPSDAENKQSAMTKLPKAKQLDTLPKNKPCDLPSPKNKTPDASSSKNKFDAFKERPSSVPKHRTSFSNSKNSESSSKERVNDTPVNSKTEHISKSSDAFPAKEKSNQGHNKSRVMDSCSNKSKSVDSEISLLSVNGHVDSESTVSSEDEKPFRKLTYSEVAMRAKDKVEKIAQELKEKERQEAMVRQHRQQEIVAQNKQAATRGPFREFPRGRIIESRPGSKEWRERRKPARAISLPAAGQ